LAYIRYVGESALASEKQVELDSSEIHKKPLMVFYHLQLVSWENVQQSHCDQNTFLTDVLINFSFFNDTYLMFPICQNPKYVKIINYLFSWLKILSKKICNSEV